MAGEFRGRVLAISPRAAPTRHDVPMNFCRDVAAAADPRRVALVERTRAGERREHCFGTLTERSTRLAGTLAEFGVRRGGVVLVLIGNRAEWVETLLACWWLGAVALPCSEQLRPADLRFRLAATAPSLVVADERHSATVQAAGPDCPVLLLPDPGAYAGEPPPPADVDSDDPALLTFTSGTSGGPKAVVHAARYLTGQRLQARHWLDARDGDLVWCTAATGWSKSARNAFIAPWLAGATALVHDARFDPHERLAIAAEERVNVWCMAPTEFRLIAKQATPGPLPAVRSLVAAGEALDPGTLQVWREAVGVDVRDGYGQTETGQLTGNPPGRPARPGSMGRALPGVRLWVADGELLVDPATVPTFFRGYLGEPTPTGPWHTGDQVRIEEDGYLVFVGRADDVIVSSGYRIGPAEVEAVLTGHPAVAECAVVAAPDPERGSVVRAVVVLRAGRVASPELVRELQEHVRRETAPYKYPRVVDFVTDLPKTATGKVRRSALRPGDPGPTAGGRGPLPQSPE